MIHHPVACAPYTLLSREDFIILLIRNREVSPLSQTRPGS
jgi:hypothetical protein